MERKKEMRKSAISKSVQVIVATEHGVRRTSATIVQFPQKMMELSRGLRTRPLRINVGPTAALNVVTQNSMFVLAFDGQYSQEIVYRHLLFLRWAPPCLIHFLQNEEAKVQVQCHPSFLEHLFMSRPSGTPRNPSLLSLFCRYA